MTVRFPVFMNYRIVVIVTNDKDRTYKKIIKGTNLPPESDFDALHVWVGSRATSYLIFQPDANPGTISHECWHAVRYVLVDFMGAKVDNEIVAYHLGYLVNRVYPFVNNKFKC